MFSIVCLGDSITCNWDSPSYVNFWQELLDQKYGSGKVRVISAGVNGETAQDGYYRLNTDVLPHHPDLVTIMFGHNEVYLNVGPATYQRYLEMTIQTLTRSSVHSIWLLSPNRIGDATIEPKYQPFLKILPQLAHEQNINYVDVWSNAFTNQDLSQIYTSTFDYAGLSGVDYLHPNALGHHLIAKELMKHSNHLTIQQ